MKQQQPFFPAMESLYFDLLSLPTALESARLALQYGASANYVFAATCQSLLDFACLKNDVAAVQYLIDNGADPNFAVDPRFLPIFCVQSREVAEILVKAGAKINVKGHLGQTPLHFACLKARLELADYYIEQGLSVDEPNIYGQTALHYSCTRLVPTPKDIHHKPDFRSGTPHELSLPLIRLLLAKGASFTKPDQAGFTPRDYSVHNGCVDQIEKCIQGIDYYPHEIFQALRSGKTDFVIEWLSKGNDPNIVERCETLAHIAATAGYCDVLEKLRECGAKLDEQLTPERFGGDWMYSRTPLFSVCERAFYPKTEKAMQFLIESGANVNTPCLDNLTPFLRLCEVGDVFSIRTMITYAYEALMSGNILPTKPVPTRIQFRFSEPKNSNSIGNQTLKKLCEIYVADENAIKNCIVAHNSTITRYEAAQILRKKAHTTFLQDPTSEPAFANLNESAKYSRETRAAMLKAGDHIIAVTDFHQTSEYKIGHERLGHLIQRLHSLVTPTADVQVIIKSNDELAALLVNNSLVNR